jgi:hypothetical protein
MEEIGTQPQTSGENLAQRSLLLTLLCLFSFVFLGLITALFLLALLYSGSITDMVFRYAPEYSFKNSAVILYILGGLLLHALSLNGTILIWKLKRLGYLLFGTSSLIISIYQLFATKISPLTTAFYIALIIAFGIFFKKLK